MIYIHLYLLRYAGFSKRDGVYSGVTIILTIAVKLLVQMNH